MYALMSFVEYMVHKYYMHNKVYTRFICNSQPYPETRKKR